MPSIMASSRLGNTSSSPVTRNSPRSTGVVRRIAQFCAATESAPSPQPVTAVIQMMS